MALAVSDDALICFFQTSDAKQIEKLSQNWLEAYVTCAVAAHVTLLQVK